MQSAKQTHRQTDRHMDATKNITSSANPGANLVPHFPYRQRANIEKVYGSFRYLWEIYGLHRDPVLFWPKTTLKILGLACKTPTN